MLIFKDAAFLHVPKTGGTWVKVAIANAGLDFEEYIVDEDIHNDLSYSPFRDRFTCEQAGCRPHPERRRV